MYTNAQVILAADELDHANCHRLMGAIGNRIYAVKIHDLYDEHGPGIVDSLRRAGAQRVWVDAKLHDIPNTARLRAQKIAKSGCEMITVHASGGITMMQAAQEGFGGGKVFGVTALTSLNNEDIRNIYHAENAAELVRRLAPKVKEAGIAGLVCSPKELVMLRVLSHYDSLELITPGIRSAGVATNDQMRVDTPGNALKAGANYLVIGRQLTQAQDPVAALDALEVELAAA
jgi:orotidine-5'-phosphate decarboxylase